MPDAVAVTGRIAERWLWWGGDGGPFGRALAGEETVPGHGGVRQRFRQGEIAWSPEQDMVTSVFLLRNEACLQWSRPGRDFDYFRYDVEIDGVGQGQAAWKTSFDDVHPEDELLIWTRLQGFGEYTFVVKSCVHHVIGADKCHGWTLPVRLAFNGLGPSPFPGETPVEGVLAERWHELGAWTGPLGHAITHAAPDEDAAGLVQVFEHGVLATVPALGSRMVVAGYQRMLPEPGSEYAHPSIELNWGGSDSAFDVFRVDVLFNGSELADVSGHVRPSPTEWARTFNGSGQFQMCGPHATGAYFFHVFAADSWNPGENVDLQTTPAFRVGVFLDSPDQSQIPMELPALDATPAAAFASHRDRTLSIVRDYARTRPLRVGFHGPVKADAPRSNEDDVVRLIAHFAAAAEEPDFCAPGELPSLALAHVQLRQLRVGHTGTDLPTENVLGVTWGREGDYDVTLRGLMVIAYRYRDLLTDAELGFILHRLVPPGLSDGHPIAVETIEVDVDDGAALGVLDTVLGTVFQVGELGLIAVPVTVDTLIRDLMGTIPESENHILMTESARYLINQLLLERTGDQRYDNNHNRLTQWLLGWLQRIAQHDFMEFNARAYARYSLHALMNLHEFAADAEIRTIAQNILDYTMVKYAVSSNQLRRVGPYRRLRDAANRVPFPVVDGDHHPVLDAQGNPVLNEDFDWLRGAHVDRVTGFFLTYAGDRTIDGRKATFPDEWAFYAVLAGTAAYRPPPEAYTLALAPSPPQQHRFYHGVRPKVAGTDDVPDGGVEIHYRSPSFMLSAGGMFLNSGYGRDENLFAHFKDTAAAQSTTLIPTRADVRFHDLIRFDPYPAGDPRTVNLGVQLGFACGANLVIPKLWYELTRTPDDGEPWTFFDLTQNLSGFGPLGFYVAAYKTDPARSFFLEELTHIVGAVGAHLDFPDSLGMLYATEAVRPDGSVLDFHQFVEATRTDTQLPARLVYGDTYDFHAGDGNVFRCWMSTAGDKYKARILALNGRPVEPADLTQLPLAEGPYLHSPRQPDGDPGDHRGVIHISTPECGAPLVLDSSDAARPSRTENADACPGFRHDRANALIAMADQSLAVSIVRSSNDLAGAVRAARSAARVLVGFDPPTEDAARYRAMRLRALVDLVGRLMTAQRAQEIPPVVAETVVAALQASSAPGAVAFDIAATVLTVSSWMDDLALHEEAIECATTAIEVLGTAAPDGVEPAPYLALVASAEFTLIVRLIAARKLDRIPAALPAVIAAYRRAADAPGSDRFHLNGSLLHLAAFLASTGLAPEAEEATTAAGTLLGV